MIASGMLEREPPFLVGFPTLPSLNQNSDVGLHHLHPNLPLVHVNGFSTEESEASSAGCHVNRFGTEKSEAGCPVFKDGSGELIGLFTIQKHYEFVIPRLVNDLSWILLLCLRLVNDLSRILLCLRMNAEATRNELKDAAAVKSRDWIISPILTP
ncbi:hypothetical protein POM88_023378 [Heracleum sosnowskyi]|uniref:Uncharacterized protein n=1 Tax=Heracleum sosnowskyi TaxID=360622 RepID=A0AAD8II63_9APIA|nr:hypothetical protein POM88_023378 [Heracleum sosnowskyi]